MSGQEKSSKLSKQLRLKAQDYLANPRNLEVLTNIIKQFENGTEQVTYLLTFEMIFTSLLKDRQMFIEIVPLKPVERTPENGFKELLKNIYEDCYMQIVSCLDSQSHKIQIQGLLYIYIILILLVLYE